jgi:hypothetical protein
MKRSLFTMTVLVALALATAPTLRAVPGCTPTGFFRDSINMTAAMINPAGTVSGTVDATGCNIGIYYSAGADAKIDYATIRNANYFGVVVNGDDGAAAVDITNSTIYNIGEQSGFNGTQHGVAIYYRSLGVADTGGATGKVSGNQIDHYQKGGIVVNGPGANVLVQNNKVNGLGPISFIAQNGIQFGFGSSGTAMKNTVTGNSYTGSNFASSGGIIVVGGDCYGGDLTTGIQVTQNSLTNNDIGVWFSNIAGDCVSAPSDPTNNKAVNNTITDDAVTNTTGSGATPYQAGVADQGNNDKIINNKISGNGYTTPPYTFTIDADASFTNRPKVHANK